MNDVDRQLDRTIAAIYDAALDATLSRTVAGEIGMLFDCSRVALWEHDLHTGVVDIQSSHGYDRTATDAYEAYFCTIDPGFHDAMRASAGAWTEVAALHRWNATRTAHAEREFINDFCKRFDVRWIAGAKFALAGSTVPFLSLGRAIGQQAFSSTEHALMSRLVGHLDTATRMRRRFAEALRSADLASASVDAVAAGIFIVDTNRRIQFANATAEQMTGTAGALTAQGGVLSSPSRAVADRLAAAVIAALEGRSGYISVPQSNADGLLTLQVARLGERHARPYGRGRPLAVVLASTRASTLPSPRDLAAFLGLTEAEGRLAWALSAGRTLETIHRDHGRSLHTLRTQLRSIFGKTGVSTQSQLVALCRATITMTGEVR